MNDSCETEMRALDMAPDAVVAIDVGGTSIKAALVDASGSTRCETVRTAPVGDGPAAVVEALREVAHELGAHAVGAGVVVPGLVDVPAGMARYSANIGWRDVPLSDILSADLGVPVVLDNDVRAGGVAERTVGRARGVADCLIVIIGAGIAGVVVAGGAAVSGGAGLAGEIGHVAVHHDGERCACGQHGCLETYASAAAIARSYAAALRADTVLSARDIVAARDNDPLAARVWEDAAEALGIALASYTMLLDPALVILGGGLAEAGDALLDPVRSALASRVTWRAVPPVELSPLTPRAGLLGAAVLAWRAAGLEDFTAWMAGNRV